MSDYYSLDNRKVVLTDLITWGRALESSRKDWRVGDTKIGDVRISTVFLGIDHRFGIRGEPLVFETMVFGGPLDGDMERCSTWEQAEAQHEAMCSKVRS